MSTNYVDSEWENIQRVRIDQIKLAPYQRITKKSRARAISATFNKNAFDPPIISYRDNTYWVVDGAHRVLTAHYNGWKDVPCRILEGLSYQEEAELFRVRNNSKLVRPVTAAQAFLAAVEAGDPNVLEVKDAVSRAGLEMPRDINCYSALQDQHAKFGLYPLLLALAVLAKTNVRPITTWILKPTVLIISQHPDAKLDRLINVIQTHWVEIDQRRRSMVRSDNKGTTKTAQIILDFYNSRLSEKNQLELRSV